MKINTIPKRGNNKNQVAHISCKVHVARTRLVTTMGGNRQLNDDRIPDKYFLKTAAPFRPFGDWLFKRRQLLNLIDSLPSIMAVLDEHGVIILANRAWMKFHSENQTPAGSRRFLGLNYLESLDACDFIEGNLPSAEFSLEAAAKLRAVLFCNCDHEALEYPSGVGNEIRWFQIDFQKRQGSAKGAVIIYVDISKRKLAELKQEQLAKGLQMALDDQARELVASEQNHRFFFEEAFDPILVTDATGKILRVNKQLEMKFGFEPAELLGQSLEILIPEKYRKDHIAHRTAYNIAPHARAMGAGGQLFGRKKDGSEFPIDVSLNSIEVNQVRQTIAIVRDITDRKRIEDQAKFLAKISKALSDTIDFLERIQRTADIAVESHADLCVISILEGESLNVAAVASNNMQGNNPASNRSSRFKLGDVAQESARLTINSLAPILVSTATRDFLIEEPDDLSLSCRRTMIDAACYLIVPMISHDRAIGTIAFVMTNSGRHYLTEDLSFFELVAGRCAVAVENAKVYRETQEAVKSRELVLSIVSHDLRNPISTIDMATQVLSDPTLLTRSTQSLLIQRIRNSATIMEKLVSDLLDFSKVQAGTFTLKTVPISISALLKASIETSAEKLAAKRIRLTTNDLTNETPIHGDFLRLVQVLWNLLGNAIKFTPEDGEISISAVESDNTIHFTVTDSGPGLTHDELPKVFDQFWQSAKTSQLGTGLGLTIAKGIVEAHHGKIWVESKSGEGCRFQFTIPI